MSCQEQQKEKPVSGLELYLKENLDKKLYHENRSVNDIKDTTCYAFYKDSLCLKSLGATLYYSQQKNVMDRMSYIIISDAGTSFYKIPLSENIIRPVYLISEMQEMALMYNNIQEVNYGFKELEYFLNNSKHLKNHKLDINTLDSIFMFQAGDNCRLMQSYEVDYYLDRAISTAKNCCGVVFSKIKQKSIENSKKILKQKLKFKNSVLLYGNSWGIKYIELNPLHNELVAKDTTIINIDLLLDYQKNNYDKFTKGNFYGLKVVHIYPN